MAITPEKRSRVLQKKNNARALPAAVQEGPLYMLRLFSLIILGVVIQTTFGPHITVLGAKPGLVLVMVVCVALIRGPVWGAGIGFITGLLLDVALVQTMGISSFLNTLAGYFSGRYGEGVNPGSWIPPVLTVFFCTLVVQFVNAVIMFLLGIEASVGFIFFRVIMPAAVLNALLASPVFIVTRWWLGGEKSHAFFAE